MSNAAKIEKVLRRLQSILDVTKQIEVAGETHLAMDELKQVLATLD